MQNKNEKITDTNYWYYNFDIKNIISATENTPVRIGLDYNSDFGIREKQELEQELRTRSKFFAIISEPTSVEVVEKHAETLAAKYLKLWKEQNSAESGRKGTFIVPVRVGNNHWATFAFNTEGEILCINSLDGYSTWNRAVIEGIKKGMKANNIRPTTQPIGIVASNIEPNYKQRDPSICGAISAEIASAISPEHSFKEQEQRLKDKMAALCSCDYGALRQKHENLINPTIKSDDQLADFSEEDFSNISDEQVHSDPIKQIPELDSTQKVLSSLKEEKTGPSIKMDVGKNSKNAFSEEDKLGIQTFFKGKTGFTCQFSESKQCFEVFNSKGGKPEKAFEIKPKQIAMTKSNNEPEAYKLAIEHLALQNPGKPITLDNVSTEAEKAKITRCFEEINKLRKEGDKIAFTFSTVPSNKTKDIKEELLKHKDETKDSASKSDLGKSFTP